MIPLPAGQVTLSDRRTQKSWTVDLQPFKLSATPVTRHEYAAHQPAATSSHGPDGNVPAASVSWWEAVRYCNALSEQHDLEPAYELAADDIRWHRSATGYRLPTEAEWEYACRAGTSGPRYGPLADIAWYRDNSGEHIHEVATKRPNAWGLHDMLGNVWDWCWDLYDPKVYGPYRSLRGGGWFDEHWSCRASVRRRSHPSVKLDDIGFRLAQSYPA